MRYINQKRLANADALLIKLGEEKTIEMNNATIHLVPEWKRLLDIM